MAIRKIDKITGTNKLYCHKCGKLLCKYDSEKYDLVCPRCKTESYWKDDYKNILNEIKYGISGFIGV